MNKIAKPAPGIRPNEVGVFGKALAGAASASAARTQLSLATVASTGAYSDLTGRPSLATVATTGDYDDLTNKPTLATVAGTGDYDDLTNKPTLATVATTNSYDDLDDKPTIPGVAPYYIEVALSGPGADVTTGAKKAMIRVHTAGTITGLVVDCDPANEPSAADIEVDLNTVDRSTGAATSVLSAEATIATSANTGTGTISGTPAVSVGDLLSLDIDAGSDGQLLIATVEITPS